MNLIIDPNKLTLLPGGVRAGIVRMDADNADHKQALSATVYSEALAHGETLFNDDGFQKVVQAIRVNKVQAYFIMAAIEHCDPKIAGASIEFPTVITEWNEAKKCFDHFPADYGEDRCVSIGFSKIFRQLTATEDSPDGIKLGTWFTHERIRRSRTVDAPFGIPSRGRVCEYSAHSVPMIKILKKLGAKLGTEEESTVLELKNLVMKRRLKVPVETEYLLFDQNRLDIAPNVFATNWSSDNGKQKIVATFTEGISSYTGDSIVRVQLTSNGHLANCEVLKDVLKSLLAAGEEEIMERRWATGNLYSIFGNPIPTMRIHAPKERKIITALKELGLQVRMLGEHATLPGLINFRDTPEEILGSVATPGRPFDVVGPSGMAYRPYFGVAA